MENKKAYKVETKPSFWVVELSNGCYSDATTQNFYFRANDDLEVWNFLCRYLEDIFPDEPWAWGKVKAIKLDVDEEEGNEPKTYVVRKWLQQEKEKGLGDTEVDWDTGYGDAWSVQISRLKVIEFCE